jgi:hypothetical protein
MVDSLHYDSGLKVAVRTHSSSAAAHIMMLPLSNKDTLSREAGATPFGNQSETAY